MKRKTGVKDFRYFVELMTQDSHVGSSNFKAEFTAEYAHVLNEVDEEGDNLAHCAVVLGQVEALKWIDSINHEALKLINKDGFNIAQLAATYDDSSELKAILELCPELVYSEFKGKNLIVLAYEERCSQTFNFLSFNYKKLLSEIPNYPALCKEMDAGSFSDDEKQIDQSIQNAILANQQKNAAAASKNPFNPGFFWSNSTQLLNIPRETPNHNGKIPFNDMLKVKDIANDLSRNIRGHIIAAGYNDFNIWLANTFITYGRDCKYQLDMDLRFSLEQSLSAALIEHSNAKSYEGIEKAFKTTFDSWIRSNDIVSIANSVLSAINNEVNASGIANFKVWLEHALITAHEHYKYSPKLDSDLSNNLAQTLRAAIVEYGQSNSQGKNFDGIRKAFSITFSEWADAKQSKNNPTAASTNPLDILSKSICSALIGRAKAGHFDNFEGWLKNKLSYVATQCNLDDSFRGMLIPALATALSTGDIPFIDLTFNEVYDEWIINKVAVNLGQGDSWADDIISANSQQGIARK